MFGFVKPRGGFPAPAGMDPRAPCRTSSPRWIPRTRGDGPRFLLTVPPVRTDSPHPRGWTPGGSTDDLDPGGFPAPAGMDPGRGRLRSTGSRIPRTRGDGPLFAARATNPKEDSPHPRGWTRERARHGRPFDGFPAPAGMDRRRRCGARSCSRIPRTRGDGPGRYSDSHMFRMDSPHPRGWTLAVALRRKPGIGFPAPAGMDPARAAAAGAGARIPRTRGDGPSR